jgi:hypothetical protein
MVEVNLIARSQVLREQQTAGAKARQDFRDLFTTEVVPFQALNFLQHRLGNLIKGSCTAH